MGSFIKYHNVNIPKLKQFVYAGIGGILLSPHKHFIQRL